MGHFKQSTIDRYQLETDIDIGQDDRSLPKELLGDDAEMVIDFGWGDYADKARHTCKTFFDVDGGKAGPNRIKLTGTGHAWRADSHKLYCEGCYQKRVRRVCEQIIQEARNYPGWDCLIHYSNRTAEQYRKDKQRWQKQKAETIYKGLPQSNGSFFVIHNRPDDIAGELIPKTRAELFKILYQYCRTPKDKRIDGSKGFGGIYQGNKGNSNKGGQDFKPEEKIKIRSKGYNGHLHELNEEGCIKPEKKPKNGIATIEGLTWPDYIKLLNTYNRSFDVIAGFDLLKQLCRDAGMDFLDLGTREIDLRLHVPNFGKEGQKGEENEPEQPLLLVDYGVKT